MDYKKIYNALVGKARVRGLNKKSVDYYTEIHHIVPKSVGGTDDEHNLVMFTGREHFIAHMLLWRMYPEDTSLMRAAFMMSSRWTSGAIEASKPQNSKTYQRLREEYAQAVSEQCSGENNPMYGKTHSPEIFERMAKTRAKTKRKKSLIDWKKTNQKYMAQFEHKTDVIEPFEINLPSNFPEFNHKLDKSIWVKFEQIKDFWVRSGKPDKKFLCNQIFEVSGIRYEQHRLRAMLDKFNNDWDSSADLSFVAMVLNNHHMKSEIEDFEVRTRKTVSEIKEEYFSNWVENRDYYRDIIGNYVIENGVEKHKNNSKAKMSLVDVIEANILWRSGKVQQKQISELYGVARNSISNALEAEGRWLSCRAAAKDLMENYFNGCSDPTSQ